MRLFHVSETPGIAEFVPDPLVWAIDEAHLVNYLVPRNCPRVTFLTPRGERIVAVEEAWRERIRETTLFIYEMPAETFTSHDAGAGYYTSGETVVPKSCASRRAHEDLLYLPELWTLRNSVTESALEFSVIRFRYASPTT